MAQRLSTATRRLSKAAIGRLLQPFYRKREHAHRNPPVSICRRTDPLPLTRLKAHRGVGGWEGLLKLLKWTKANYPCSGPHFGATNEGSACASAVGPRALSFFPCGRHTWCGRRGEILVVTGLLLWAITAAWDVRYAPRDYGWPRRWATRGRYRGYRSFQRHCVSGMLREPSGWPGVAHARFDLPGA